MKLNLDYYTNTNIDLTENEKKIIEYINQNDKKEYKNIIEKDFDLENILALSSIRNNILNWYPFKENSNILEIYGNYGEITEELCLKANKVITIEENKIKADAIAKRHSDIENLEVIVGKIPKIQLKEKFNYVIVNKIDKNEESLEEIIKFIKLNTLENSTILIMLDNKYGLQTNNKNVTNMKLEKKYISKNQIEKEVNKLGYKNVKFYYPLPNYKTPNIIFTDAHIPSSESILRDLTLYSKDEIIVENERKKYIDIIKDDPQLFSFFANSYLIEISNNEDNKIEFVSFGNSRKKKYKMKTIMKNDIVYKEPVDYKETSHLERIKNNIDILKKSNFNMLDEFKENRIYSKLVKEEKSFDKVLIQLYMENKYNEFISNIRNFFEQLEEKLEKVDIINIQENTVFEKNNIKIDKKMKEELNFVKYGIYDLIFQNAFYIDNKFYFYDQEWIQENTPIEFIKYRAINYLANSRQEIDRNKIYKEFGLDKYIEKFEKLEEILQKEIKDEIIWSIHENNHTTIQNLCDTCTHYKNLKDIAENEKILINNEKTQIVNKKDEEIKELNGNINSLKNEIEAMKNSASWKITKPLRKIRSKINKNN